jgi:hypothetical protein
MSSRQSILMGTYYLFVSVSAFVCASLDSGGKRATGLFCEVSPFVPPSLPRSESPSSVPPFLALHFFLTLSRTHICLDATGSLMPASVPPQGFREKMNQFSLQGEQDAFSSSRPPLVAVLVPMFVDTKESFFRCSFWPAAGRRNDLHCFAAGDNAWTALSPSGSAPSPRDAMGFAATPGGMLYVFGGQDGGGNWGGGSMRTLTSSSASVLSLLASCSTSARGSRLQLSLLRLRDL